MFDDAKRCAAASTRNAAEIGSDWSGEESIWEKRPASRVAMLFRKLRILSIGAITFGFSLYSSCVSVLIFLLRKLSLLCLSLSPLQLSLSVSPLGQQLTMMTRPTECCCFLYHRVSLNSAVAIPYHIAYATFQLL